MYDVIVVGGSYAGMAAALQLVRGRRDVAVLDSGQRRNRFAGTSHGLLGQDGRSPAEIAGEAKAQLAKYPSLSWHDDTAVGTEKIEDKFIVRTTKDEVLTTKRLVLATGVTDELPPIPGLAERWGRSVFHCPYCHGYELNNGPLGVLATGEASMHQALLIPEWGQTTLFTNSVFEPDDEQRKQLQSRAVVIERTPVVEIIDHARVKLSDGRLIELAGLFVAPRFKPASPLADELGCEFAESPLGNYVKTDETKETSVAGVFACGDVARAAGNISFAIADGAMAGIGAHRSLIFEKR